jgi:hypothetical protein
MPIQQFPHVPRDDLQSRLVSPGFQAQRLSAEHPGTRLASNVDASQTLRLSASSTSAATAVIPDDSARVCNRCSVEAVLGDQP